MDTNNQTESVFHQDSFVTVTQSRYITRTKTYAMRNISSVHIFEIVKSKLGPILFILLGLPFLLSKNVFWIGLIIIALGIWWFISIKNLYAVRISTNAGEANSFITKNKQYAETIINALNEAIIQRG